MHVFAEPVSVLPSYQKLLGIPLASSVNTRVVERRARRYGIAPHAKLPRFTLLISFALFARARKTYWCRCHSTNCPHQKCPPGHFALVQNVPRTLRTSAKCPPGHSALVQSPPPPPPPPSAECPPLS